MSKGRQHHFCKFLNFRGRFVWVHTWFIHCWDWYHNRNSEVDSSSSHSQSWCSEEMPTGNWRGFLKFLPPENEVCEGYVFTGVCLSTGGEHVWLLWGGSVHGCSGGGHVWLLWGGMCGCCWRGVHGCSRGGGHGIWRYTEIRSMSGRYASYRNASLFLIFGSIQNILMWIKQTFRHFISWLLEHWTGKNPWIQRKESATLHNGNNFGIFKNRLCWYVTHTHTHTHTHTQTHTHTHTHRVCARERHIHRSQG